MNAVGKGKKYVLRYLKKWRKLNKKTQVELWCWADAFLYRYEKENGKPLTLGGRSGEILMDAYAPKVAAMVKQSEGQFEQMPAVSSFVGTKIWTTKVDLT